MHITDLLPVLALLQAAAEESSALADPFLKLLMSIAHGSPVAAILGIFLWKEWQRRDIADKANLAEHKTTQIKVDEVKDGYHGLREEFIRARAVDGKCPRREGA